MILKKTIPGFSQYIATSDGHIIGINGQNLLATPRPDGYRQIEIVNDEGDYRLVYVHRLIASTFLGLALDDYTVQVDHRNNDRSNCALDNLQILSRSDNMLKAFEYIYGSDTELMKRCRKCNVVQPRANFGLKKASKDGISAYCKPCSNIYPRRK